MCVCGGAGICWKENTCKRDIVILGSVGLSGLLIVAEVAFQGMCTKPFLPLDPTLEKGEGRELQG